MVVIAAQKMRGRDGAADFGNGQIRMRERFLIMHDGVIHREAEQDRRETHADDVDRAENQTAERQRRGQNQAPATSAARASA